MVSTPVRLEELTVDARISKRRMTILWMLVTAFVGALSVALKKPTLAPFPGTEGDPVMVVLAFVVVTGSIALMLKVPAVVVVGPMLERWLHGDVRRVRLGDLRQKGIRWPAFWGGSLQAGYQMLFIALVTYLAPAALSAAKVCVILPLAVLELTVGQLKPGGLRWWLRLGLAMGCTLAGAGIVIFDGGFLLFRKETGWLPLLLLLLYATVGNALLAIAERQEYIGVHHGVVAAPVYSLARVVVYVATCMISLLVWGAVNGGWSIAWHVLLMCLDRWELVVPIALLGALVDTSRICVKVVISATFMYIMLATVVAIDVVLQAGFHERWPEYYDNVRSWEHTLVFAGGGALLIFVGMLLYPHDQKSKAL